MDLSWTLGPVEVSNNVIANPSSSANCLLCVEDYSRKNTAEQMKITANGNIYVRSSASQPTWLAVWSRGSVNVNPYVFTSLAASPGSQPVCPCPEARLIEPLWPHA